MIDALLIIIILIFVFIIGYIIGKKLTDHSWQDKIPDIRADAIQKSRAVLGGQFSEQLAPYLPDFPFNPTEARFIGKPIDFLVFKGMDEKDIKEVIFVEVKSGKAKMNAVEKTLKNVIDEGKIRWHEYRIPEDITRKKE